MRTPLAFAAALLAASLAAAACHSAPPPPPPPPIPLSDSATAALTWVAEHRLPTSEQDSVPTAQERANIYALTAGARIIGFSELIEGTHEFPYVIRRVVMALADSGLRGIALQASMADAMEVDRYVRGGMGDIRRLLRDLNPPESQRIATREMFGLVETIRAWNHDHPDKQIGFYGFEIPTASHAVASIVTLPDSIFGAPLKAWLAQRYACVAMNEGAQWGREGRAADSTFWSSCGPATVAAADSVAAVGGRAGARSVRARSDLAFALQMARLIQHHVSVGLRRMSRQDANAEHVMFLADMLGPNAKLLLWGGDWEMGRLVLDNGRTIQTAVPLGQRLGARYRAIGVMIGDGVLRARVPNPMARSAEQPGIGDARILPPSPNTYDDVFNRVNTAAYWIDLRTLPSDMGGTWLKGPHPIRMIAEQYVVQSPTAVETPIPLQTGFDAIIFFKHVTPARPF